MTLDESDDKNKMALAISSGVAVRRSGMASSIRVQAAKACHEQRRLSLLEPYRATGVLGGELDVRDPAPYGFAANRLAMSTIAGYLQEQGLTDRVVGLDEIIPASMLQT